jgi:hypothetical protein
MHYYFGEEEDGVIDYPNRPLRAYEGKQQKMSSAAISVCQMPCPTQFQLISISKSISTALSRGRLLTPTATRACLPFSPNSCTSRSEAPLMTLG